MIKNYLTIARRNLLRRPFYSLVNILGLSLGLTGGILLFMFVGLHLSADSFHPNADRIYRLVMDIHSPDGSIEHEPGTSVAMIDVLKEDYPQIENTAMAMFFYLPPTLAVPTASESWEPYVEHQGVAYGTPSLLSMFDIPWLAGNRATALREPGQVVLSERQALKYFGTTEALGKVIRMNQQHELMVSGIIATPPANTDLPIDVLISFPTLKVVNPNYQMDNFAWHGYNNWLFVELQPGAEAGQIDRQLPDFRQKYLGDSFAHWSYHLQPLEEMHFDERYSGTIRKPLLMALGLTGVFLILVAGINFVNLATAQASRKAREVGIRKTMGSTRPQLFGQFITETAVLTLLAAALSGIVIPIILPYLNQWLNTSVPLTLLAHPGMIGLLAGIVLLVIALAGSYPAVVLSGFGPTAALKSHRTSERGSALTIRKGLVLLQFTIAQVFTIAALIILYQTDYLRNTPMGFEKDTILTVSLPGTAGDQGETFRNELIRHSAIEGVSRHHRPPVTDNQDGGYVRFDQRENLESFMVRDRWADAQYLSTYDLNLVSGRNIQARDSVTEFVVNEEFVRRLGFTHPQDVLDKVLYNDNTGVEGTIVGVVEDFHHQSLQYAIEPLAIYSFPRLYRQAGIRLNTENVSEVLAYIQQSWSSTFPDRVFEYEFLDDTIARMYQQETTMARLTHVFTMLIIVICLLGLYGLVQFVVGQRTREIGIRKVLGASVPGVLLLLTRDYLKLIAVALLIAIPLANYLLTNWLNHFAYRITLHWWLLVLPGLLLLFVALLAIGGQTVKAARQNPVDSLRDE